MSNRGILGRRTRAGYPPLKGGDTVVVSPFLLEAGTGDDRDGILALPICTTKERLLMMFSALNVGADLIYPDKWADAVMDFWQALEHVNKPEECECSERFMIVPQWELDPNPPENVVRGRWRYPNGDVTPYTPNLRGENGQDGKSPEIRTVELSAGVYQLQWRYIGESDTSWRVLQNLADGLTPEFRYFDGYLQYKYTNEPVSAWRDVVQLRDGLTPEFRTTDTGLVQWRYIGETVWQTLYTRITAVDLDIVAPNQPSDAVITGNVLQLDIARARNPEMRALGQTIQWRQEGLSYADLVTVECCEPQEVTPPADPSEGQICYAIERTVSYVERVLQDILNAYDANLDPLNRTDAAEELAADLGRRLLRGARRLPFIGTISALFEEDVTDVEAIEASMTISRREDMQEVAYCELINQFGAFNGEVWDRLKARATSSGYSEHEGKNWFRDVLDALSFDEVRDRYNLYLRSGNVSATCASYDCSAPDWCVRFDFRLNQTWSFTGFSVNAGLGGLQSAIYDVGGTIRSGVNAERQVTLPAGSVLTRIEITFDMDFNSSPFGENVQVGIVQAGGNYVPLGVIPQGDYSDYVLSGNANQAGTFGVFMQVSAYTGLSGTTPTGTSQVREMRLYGTGTPPDFGVSCP